MEVLMEQNKEDEQTYIIGDTTYFIQRTFKNKTIDEIIEDNLVTENLKSHN